MKLVTCRFVGGPEGAGMKNDAIQYTTENAHLVISRLHHALFQLLVLKALSRDAVFHATCNAILVLADTKLANTSFHHSLLIYFQRIKHLSQIYIS